MRFFYAILIALFAISLNAKEPLKMPKDFRSVMPSKAQIVQDGKGKMFCKVCGMYLPKFYKTNHAAVVDGKKMQFCSIHCLAETIASGKKVKDIEVIDNTTLKFIPANKAWYVVGSKKPATMSKVSKYAFGTKEAAEHFAKENGGKVMPFKEVLDLVLKNLKKESAEISKKQAKMAKMGKMILAKKCKAINKKFDSVADAKAYVKGNNLCQNINGKELQAIGLYLVKGVK